MEEKSFCGLRCLLRFPRDFREGERVPMILFLHGAGTRGNDMDVLAENSFFQLTAKHKDFPFAVLAPLCNENTWFDLMESLKALALEAQNLPFVDPDRLYLVGVSMGGYAAWQLAMCLPDVFAALVPLCGGGMYWNAKRIAHLPIWAFHGEKDTVVLPSESVNMVRAINRNGGSAKLTLYPENCHNVWTDTFSNETVFVWLSQQRRGKSHEESDSFSSSERFG